MAEIRRDLADAFSTGDDFTIVSAVRQWAYERIDRAGEESLTLDANYNEAWNERGWVNLFQALEDDEGGFYCGGAATMLAEIYRALGYDATVFNFGEPRNEATHVVTLVYIISNGRPILSIQDAYFGYTILDSGAPAHFGDLLGAIDTRDVKRFTVSENEGCKPILTSDELLRAYVSSMYQVSNLKSRSELLAFCHDFGLRTFLERDPQGEVFLDTAEALGYPRNILFLMRNQIGVDYSGLIDAVISAD